MPDRRISRRNFVKAASVSAAGLALGASTTTSGMQYRRLGRTGLMVSELGIGCSPHGQRKKFRPYCEAMPEVIRRGLDLGINIFDTGPSYRTQPMVGAALKGVQRDSFILCSKSEQTRKGKIVAELEQSLRELQTDHVDVLHEHAHYTSIVGAYGRLEFVEACEQLKKQGKVRFFGVAGHDPDVLAEYVRTGHFDTVMAPFNYLTRRPAQELFPLAKRLDVGVFAIKPLTGNYKPWERPAGSNKKLDALVKRYNASDYFEAGLKFVLSNANVSCAMCGMERVVEVEQNAAMAGKRFARRDNEVMNAYAAAVGGEYCRLCEACLPCPRGVAIPDVQRFHMYHDNYGHYERGKRLYAELPAEQRADRCSGCGECEKRCPNGLPIRAKLEAAHRALA